MALKYLLTNQLFSKLEVRIITDAPRNIDACIVDGMFLVQFHVDLPSTFGGQAKVTLSRLVRRANHVYCAFDTFKYPLINDITRDHGLVKGEVNVSGPEQGILKYFTQTLKSERFKTSQLRLLAEVWCRNEQANAM